MRTAALSAFTPAKETRRVSLLEAACAAIARGGLRGLRVDEIAAEAGVSTGLVYYHFRDRAGLLTAAFDHAYAVVSDAADAGTDALPPTRRLLARALGEFPSDERTAGMAGVWFEMWSTARFEPALLAHVQTLVDRWTRGFAEVIREAQAIGEVDGRVDPDASATRVIALVEGLRPRWLQGELATDAAQAMLAEGIRRELLCPAPFAPID